MVKFFVKIIIINVAILSIFSLLIASCTYGLKAGILYGWLPGFVFGSIIGLLAAFFHVNAIMRIPFENFDEAVNVHHIRKVTTVRLK